MSGGLILPLILHADIRPNSPGVEDRPN